MTKNEEMSDYCWYKAIQFANDERLYRFYSNAMNVYEHRYMAELKTTAVKDLQRYNEYAVKVESLDMSQKLIKKADKKLELIKTMTVQEVM